MDVALKHVLVVDIETVSAQPSLDQLSPELQEHWKRKAGFLRNEADQTEAELFEERAGIYAEFGRVVVISFGFFHESSEGLSFRTKTLYDTNEKVLLESFVGVLKKFDPLELRLCAHNGKEFDFPYLSRRLLINGLSLPWVLDLSGKKPWEVQHIDTLDLWKFGDRKSFTSLALLCEVLGIPSSKQDMDGSMVSGVYYGEMDGLKK